MKRLIFISFFLFIFSSPLFAGKIVNKIVATVGDEVLTLYELDRMAEPFYKAYFKPDMDPVELERLKTQIRKEVLNQWIEDTLIGLEAKKFNIKVTEEELTQYIKETYRDNATEILKDPALKDKLRDQLMKIKFIQLTVREKIAIPEEELKEAYKEYVKNYDPEPKYELEILIIKEELLVKEIYEEVLQGKSFDTIVRNYKDQTYYFREIFKEKELDPTILSSLKKLKPGEVLPPQKRGEVFQIIRLVRFDTGTLPSYEEVKNQLYEKLFQKKAQNYIEKWIKELKENKFVKIYL